MPRNDLNLDNGAWRQYLGVINVGTWISHKTRGSGGDPKYPGNFIPQLLDSPIARFTKQGDLVVDLFSGGETTADVCARKGRRFEGCDLRPKSPRTSYGDARTWKPSEPPQLVILHPPYASIIDYNEKLGAHAADLSLEVPEFLKAFADVAANAYAMTAPEGYAMLVMGDCYRKDAASGNGENEHIMLGFESARVMREAGWVLKSVSVKDFGDGVQNKGKYENIWFLRAIKNDFNVLEHEYVFIFVKPSQKEEQLRALRLTRAAKKSALGTPQLTAIVPTPQEKEAA